MEMMIFIDAENRLLMQVATQQLAFLRERMIRSHNNFYLFGK